jgi:hypothetical protein
MTFDGQTLNKAGIVLQVLAAAYIVFQAGKTAHSLRDMKVTYDSLEDVILQLGREMSSQFRHQLYGFLVLALGALLQLVG